jgi:hypothetical protein
MADSKISLLTALTGANLATDDEFAVVDTSVTTTKKITVNELLTGLLGGTCTFDTTYALATAATFGWSTDLILRRAAAANLALGAADAASPVAQTISVQSVVAGTTDTDGADFTLKASLGTGTGKSGKFIFQLANHAAGTGSAQNTHFNALTIRNASNVPTGRPVFYYPVNYTIFDFGDNWLVSSGDAAYFLEQHNSTAIKIAADMGFSWSVAGYAGAGGATDVTDASLWRSAAGVVLVGAASASAGGALEFIEQTAPSAPSANRVRIFAEDNGSGKTRLMARFNSGAAQQIAIEP